MEVEAPLPAGWSELNPLLGILQTQETQVDGRLEGGSQCVQGSDSSVLRQQEQQQEQQQQHQEANHNLGTHNIGETPAGEERAEKELVGEEGATDLLAQQQQQQPAQPDGIDGGDDELLFDDIPEPVAQPAVQESSEGHSDRKQQLVSKPRRLKRLAPAGLQQGKGEEGRDDQIGLEGHQISKKARMIAATLGDADAEASRDQYKDKLWL
eukprot:1157631-Pelagomonas_calceolata.AAC.3